MTQDTWGGREGGSAGASAGLSLAARLPPRHCCPRICRAASPRSAHGSVGDAQAMECVAGNSGENHTYWRCKFGGAELKEVPPRVREKPSSVPDVAIVLLVLDISTWGVLYKNARPRCQRWARLFPGIFGIDGNAQHSLSSLKTPQDARRRLRRSPGIRLTFPAPRVRADRGLVARTRHTACSLANGSRMRA